MINSHIGWTDDTYNPITMEGGGFYCFKVSPGCTNCYAETVNNRFNHDNALPYRNMKEYPNLVLNEGMLAGWARKKKSRKNFLSSMTDVFGEFVPDEWVYKILDAMVAAPLQVFQVLTKRSERMKELVFNYCESRGLLVLPENIWLIVSVENQECASRVVDLIATRCQIRGLSIEPMLEYVDLTMPQLTLYHWTKNGPTTHWDSKIIAHIDWVIVGGESGNKARVMNPKWVYNMERQCRMYNVPFFFKQWGEWVGGIWNKNEGIVKLEDGETHIHGFRQPIVYHGIKVESDPNWEIVSVRAGKKIRDIPFKDTFIQSDNALLNGKHYFEFPHYLNT